MAASTPYTVFTGVVELTGVVLLVFSRTALVGALLLFGALTNVLVLDLAFNVRGPAVIAAMSMVLAVIVCAPYARDLWGLVIRRSVIQLSEEPKVISANPRLVAAAKLVALSLLLVIPIRDGLAARRTYFGAGQSVYGLFDVERIVRNGTVVSPSAGDNIAWKRLASDGRYGHKDVLVQFANGDLRPYRVTDDVESKTLLLRPRGSETVTANLHYNTSDSGVVTLSGTIGTDTVEMSLRRVDPRRYPILPPW